MVNQTSALLAEAEETGTMVLETALPGQLPIDIPGDQGTGVDGGLPSAVNPDDT